MVSKSNDFSCISILKIVDNIQKLGSVSGPHHRVRTNRISSKILSIGFESTLIYKLNHFLSKKGFVDLWWVVSN